MNTTLWVIIAADAFFVGVILGFLRGISIGTRR